MRSPADGRNDLAMLIPAPERPLTASILDWSAAQLRAGRALVIVGIAIRLALYFSNRALWGDEASVAVNVISRSFRQLTLPLDFEQGAPLGFLFIERIAVLLFGESEFTLRFIPLLSSILLLEICFRLVRRFFSASTGLAALSMAVFAKSLVHFSVELKQYSSDAMLAAWLLYCAMRLRAAIDRGSDAARAVAWFALLGATAVWFSHPAIFVVGGVGAVIAYTAWRKGQLRLAIQMAAATALGGASAFCHYFFFARALTRDTYLTTFWTAGMMPLYPPLKVLRWFCQEIPESFRVLFGTTGVPLTILFFMLGCATLWRTRRQSILALLMMPALLTLCASAMHQYPFSDRMIVFLLPLLIVLLAAGFDGLYRWLPVRWNWIALLLFVALLAEPVAVAVKDALHRSLKEDIRPALVYLQAHRQEQDAIYIHIRGRPAFQYYAHRYGFDPAKACLGRGPIEPEFIEAELAQFLDRDRVWILRATTDDKAEHYLRAALEQMDVTLQEETSARGVILGRYDLR